MKIYPNKYLKKVENIDIDMLKENGIKSLILDVDNTLVDLSKKVSDSIVLWSKNIKKEGIQLYILSNSNDIKKLDIVSNKISAPYERFAKKPFKSGFIKVQKKLNLESNEIAVVGDQIFTDVIGGNRCNMFTILVDPLEKKEFWYTAWKRPIEDIIKRKFIKNQSSKGEKDVF